MKIGLPRLDRWAIAAALLAAFGIGWRIWLTFVSSPPTNSDEATMGLAAMHVSQGRELPVFFYGQHYMGTIEAYLAAPWVALLGPSVTALRIPTLLLYALFLLLMFLLVRRLFSPGLAVLTVGLLAFGADRVVKNQLIAGGGYPETAPMVAGLLLLTYVLVARPQTRWFAFAAWGLLFGLIVWNHWLALPYLLGALIVVVAARVFTGRTAKWAVGGFLFGVLPLLVDNLLAWPRNNSIAVFLGLNSAGTDAALWDRIIGGVWLGLPLGMGMCAPSRCDGWSLWWSPVIVVLLTTAAVMSARMLRRTTAMTNDETGGQGVSGRDRARQALHLVLATAGLLSILSYARSPAAADSPIESARYLSLLAISLPAALWPLWQVIRSASTFAIPAMIPIAALAATMLAATVSLTSALPGYRSVRADQAQLVAALHDADITYVHSEYWTCNWLTFLSGERVVCGVVDDQLNPGLNRYPGYWRPQAQALVAPIGSPLDQELAHRMPWSTPRVVAGYHVYLSS